LLTLYITPVYYVYLEQLRSWLARRPATQTVPQAVAAVQGIGRIEERPV
jgi:hypothetical protein